MKSRLILKYRSLPASLKAMLWFTFCSLLQKGISFLTSPIFARMMSTEEYGTYNLFLSWFNILSIVTSLSLYSGVFNNAMLKYKDDRDKYISSMQGLTIVLTIVFFVVFWAGHEWFEGFLGLTSTVMAFMFLDLLFAPSLQFWSARQRFEYKYIGLVVITVLQSVFNPLLGYLAIRFIDGDKSFLRIISIVAVDVTICLTLMIIQFARGRSFFNGKYWKYALRFNLPLIPHYLSGVILNQGDRIMINHFFGKTSVAIYSVAYSMGMLTTLFVNSFNGAFTPWMYEKMSKGEYSQIRRTFNFLCVLMLAIVVLLCTVAPEIVWLFGTDNYQQAQCIIPPIACSVFFLFEYIIFSNLAFYYEKTSFVAVASVVVALLNIGLNAVFLPLFGYSAAAYTTLACYFFFCLGHAINCAIICRKKGLVEKVYDLKVLTILSAIAVTIACTAQFLYLVHPLFRYCILIALVLFAIIFRKRIAGVLGLFGGTSKTKNEDNSGSAEEG